MLTVYRHAAGHAGILVGSRKSALCRNGRTSAHRVYLRYWRNVPEAAVHRWKYGDGGGVRRGVHIRAMAATPRTIDTKLL